MRYNRVLILIFLCHFSMMLYAQTNVRIKDISYINGVRENQLMGLGIVTGLQGRGDSSRSDLLRFTLSNLVSSFGVNMSAEAIRSRNSAVVIVTADIPPFVRSGDRLTVHVSSVGDASSLTGGMLLQTNLRAANEKVYAVAQGPVAGSTRDDSIETVATVPNGAIVEQSVLSNFVDQGRVSVVLMRPDFTTASLVASSISEAFEDIEVTATDASLITVEIPEGSIDNPVGFISEIENLTIDTDSPAKVVINPRSGVVVLGNNVKIGKVAISYRGDNINIGTPFGSEDQKEQFLLEESTTVDDLVTVLQEVGIKTDVIIEILKAVDQAGALYGELIIM